MFRTKSNGTDYASHKLEFKYLLSNAIFPNERTAQHAFCLWRACIRHTAIMTTFVSGYFGFSLNELQQFGKVFAPLLIHLLVLGLV